MSDAYIASIAADEQFIHPDFGSNPNYGIPYSVVPADQKPVKVKFTQYPDESDPGRTRSRRTRDIEGGGDRHVLVVQDGTCKLYELYPREAQATRQVDRGERRRLRPPLERAASGGLDVRRRRRAPDPPGPRAPWTRSTAGAINHALRFTVERTQRGYVDPARHFASSITDPNLPPLGLRVRLKASFDISGFTGASRVILKALKKYGMFIADNGTAGTSAARPTRAGTTTI